jgi:hypothetical protein
MLVIAFGAQDAQSRTGGEFEGPWIGVFTQIYGAGSASGAHDHRDQRGLRGPTGHRWREGCGGAGLFGEGSGEGAGGVGVKLGDTSNHSLERIMEI